MISIDGSMGEGGGQVLRTSLALSMVTGQPFRIDNIRAGRPKPGLMRQHLTSVEAARHVCGGEVIGAKLGSSSVQFSPGPVRGGDYEFAVGTAGSTTLVLQTILPALATAAERSTVSITGGTHNAHAPSVHFLDRAFLPLLRRMGPDVGVDLERHGFYPAGGGRIHVSIEPTERWRSIELFEASEVTGRRAVATVAGLPEAIGVRELAVLRDRFGWVDDDLHLTHLGEDMGPGNVLSIEIARTDVTEVFTGFGERGVTAERVATSTGKSVQRYLAANVPVWRHLADQLMLPLTLAGAGGFITGPLSNHVTTNAAVIESFLDVKILFETLDRGHVRVTVMS